MAGRWNTNWTGVRTLDAKAIVVETVPSEPGTVIYVPECKIRNATIENVCFQVAPGGRGFHTYDGKERVEVLCLWYGRKPPSSWMNITLPSGYKTLKDKSVEIVRNIARRRP